MKKTFFMDNNYERDDTDNNNSIGNDTYRNKNRKKKTQYCLTLLSANFPILIWENIFYI